MGKTFELLNCDKHKALLLRNGRDPGEVRPDITHQVPAGCGAPVAARAARGTRRGGSGPPSLGIAGPLGPLEPGGEFGFLCYAGGFWVESLLESGLDFLAL